MCRPVTQMDPPPYAVWEEGVGGHLMGTKPNDTAKPTTPWGSHGVRLCPLHVSAPLFPQGVFPAPWVQRVCNLFPRGKCTSSIGSLGLKPVLVYIRENSWTACGKPSRAEASLLDSSGSLLAIMSCLGFSAVTSLMRPCLTQPSSSPSLWNTSWLRSVAI